ncbi:MAG: FHA domain-containing protein [Nitriliruptorales bacterium]|nr:FHA domain-containing protein [Nitriliruptorales bacterium]
MSGSLRVRVLPGEGLVAKKGGGVLVALPGGSADRLDAILAALEEVCASEAAPGRLLARRLTSQLASANPDEIPPFGVAAPTREGWALFLHGEVRACVVGDGPDEHLCGLDAATWLDRVLDGPVSLVALGRDTRLEAGDQRLHLEDGIVPGSAALLQPAQSIARPRPTSEPAAPGREPPARPGRDAWDPAAFASPAAAAASAAPAPSPEPPAVPQPIRPRIPAAWRRMAPPPAAAEAEPSPGPEPEPLPERPPAAAALEPAPPQEPASSWWPRGREAPDGRTESRAGVDETARDGAEPMRPTWYAARRELGEPAGHRWPERGENGFDPTPARWEERAEDERAQAEPAEPERPEQERGESERGDSSRSRAKGPGDAGDDTPADTEGPATVEAQFRAVPQSLEVPWRTGEHSTGEPEDPSRRASAGATVAKEGILAHEEPSSPSPGSPEPAPMESTGLLGPGAVLPPIDAADGGLLRTPVTPSSIVREARVPAGERGLHLPHEQRTGGQETGDGAPAGEPQSAADPEADLPFESVPLVGGEVGEPVEARDPLPVVDHEDRTAPAVNGDEVLVEGILCERGHFNHPRAQHCAQCGVVTSSGSGGKATGPRPSLGVLLLDDGTTFTLDAEYVVGREPELDTSVQNGRVRPLRLVDPQRSVSRVHATIDLEDWRVFVVDRGSSNGTYVAPRGAREWTRLQEHLPHPLTPGTRMAVGQRILTFNTHHQVSA